MQGIERKYCDVCINAVIGAWRALMEAAGAETLRKTSYGKGDTLGLDAITEITIKHRLEEFDSHAFLITEELDEQSRRRWPTDSDPILQPLMFFSDPIDRSNQLEPFYAHLSKDNVSAKIGNLMAACDAKKLWEEMFEAPASITGASSAITCVRKGEIVFSVILNLITATLCVVSDAGVYLYQLGDFSDPANEDITLAMVLGKGQPLHFHCTRDQKYTADDCKRFVTFLGKSGYRENFNDSMLFMENPDNYLHHSTPPGPPRVLYLSELQKGFGPIGFVMANGEKIGEWMSWLAFVKFVTKDRARPILRAFEISLGRPWTKNDMLMSTSRPYSIFTTNDQGTSYLDMSKLRNFERPSQFRSMLIVLPCDNERIIHVLEQHGYREVTGCF
jgi:hypothetical protein